MYIIIIVGVVFTGLNVSLLGSHRRGGRPGLSVLMSMMVSVDVKQQWTMLTHWSQLVPNNYVNRHPRTGSSTSSAQCSGAVWKSRWSYWAPTVSVDVKQHSTNRCPPYRVQELCESRGGRPGLPVLMSLMVSVDVTVKQHWTMLRHWSQFVPNMSADIRGHEALYHHHLNDVHLNAGVIVVVAV